jgi:DNA-binding NarL/FixJ family response regulator
MNLAEDIPILGTRYKWGRRMNKIRVLVADDHPTFRQGLCYFLSKESDIDVIAEAANGEETLNLCRELSPDVAIIDISMPGINGIETTNQIKKTFPSISVIIVSEFDYESYLFASLRAGASGFMLKGASVSDFIQAVRLISKGRAVFDYKFIDQFLKISLKSNDFTGIPDLHRRELEVLEAVGAGLTNQRIAEKLGIGPRTVQTHLSHVFRKLKTHSRTQAVLQAMQMGYLNPDSSRQENELSTFKQ